MKTEPAVIRPAESGDVAAIHAMIGELADFEKLRDAFVTTEAQLHEALFGSPPAAEALVAVIDGEVNGYAIFFTTFSTFLAKTGLWLEDLYVRPEHRGKGVGKRLLREGARLARERGYGRYEWCVLDWNQHAIDVYEAAGATVLPDWRIARMEGEAIDRLAGEAEA